MTAHAKHYVSACLQKLPKWAAANAAGAEANGEIENTEGRNVRNDNETLVLKGVPFPHEVGQKALRIQ